jgi:hypothetical protein
MPNVPPSNQGRRKILVGSFVLLTLVIAGVWLFNYWGAERPLERALKADPRDQGVLVQAHFDHWIDTGTLVFDLTGTSGNTTGADVFRTFLEYAQAMRERQVAKVVLASRGKDKFMLDGSYFQQLGREYDKQNPIYTIRTFPTHLTSMDGTKPFSEYGGGILGVLQKELEQFNEFSDQWYLKDFQAAALPVTAGADTAKSNAEFDPCEGLRETDPHCGWKPHWDDSGVSVNLIDGAKTEFLSLESSLLFSPMI